MNTARTLATATRVLRQLSHDRRSLALLLLVPCVMLFLLRYVFDGAPRTFDSIGASLLGIFPLITMFLVTSIATLRERTSGTLERLLAMPLGKADIIAGYALAFGALAVVQSVLATALALWGLGLDINGSAWLLLLVALLDALLGTALGLFVSAFAASEFQAVQFMPHGDLPATPAVRTVRRALQHATRPGGRLERPAHVVRGGRYEPDHDPPGRHRRLRPGRRCRRGLRAAGPHPRRRHPQTPHPVTPAGPSDTARTRWHRPDSLTPPAPESPPAPGVIAPAPEATAPAPRPDR